MFFLSAHFFFALTSWYILTAVLGETSFAIFEKSEYLSIIGSVRYGVPLIFSAFSGYLISKQLNKQNLLLLVLVTTSLVFSSNLLATPELKNLLVVAIFFLFSGFYEPVANLVAAGFATKKGNFITINSLLNLTRTSARFLGPLLGVFIVGLNQDFLTIPTTSGILLSLIFISFLFIKLPEPKDSTVKKVAKAGFISQLNSLRNNFVATSILSVYMLFYLGVSYVEYLPMLTKSGNLQTHSLYASLGGGFLFANFVLLILGKKIQSPITIFIGSLLATAVSIIFIPYSSENMVLPILFLVGNANALSVSVSASLFQKYLPRELLGTFVGVLGTCTSLCGLISMGVALLVNNMFGYQAVFMVNGTLILLSSILWLGTYRRFQNEVNA
jgi:hypothetical protein